MSLYGSSSYNWLRTKPCKTSCNSCWNFKRKTATTINQVCGSGLASVALAYNSIKCEDGHIIIAGWWTRKYVEFSSLHAFTRWN